MTPLSLKHTKYQTVKSVCEKVVNFKNLIVSFLRALSVLEFQKFFDLLLAVDEPPQAQTQHVIFLDIDSFHPIDLVVLPTPGWQGMHSFLTYLILY